MVFDMAKRTLTPDDGTIYHMHICWPLSSGAKLIMGCGGKWLMKDGRWLD
jgi:hypothetical protein